MSSTSLHDAALDPGLDPALDPALGPAQPRRPQEPRAPNRASIDPDRKTALLLGERYPELRTAILASDRLLAGLRALRLASNGRPEWIAAEVGARELDTAQRPIGVLVSRCGELVATFRSPPGGWAELPTARRPASAPVEARIEADEVTTAHGSVAVDEPHPAAPMRPRSLEDLVEDTDEEVSPPPTQGWPYLVRRLSRGLVTPDPGTKERARRRDVAAVQATLGGPRTVVVVNPKGGANKTTAALLIAATFGVLRGGYTLAWDNNETNGTLGWRARQPGHHRATAVDLLRDLDGIASVAGRVGDLDRYVRSQTSARFDVLASDENPQSNAVIDDTAFLRLHDMLQRFYRIMIVDTGNNVRASNWQAAVDVADQLVVVTTVAEDTGKAAAWLADSLRAGDHEAKLANAVTVVAAPARSVDTALRERLHEHFGALTRAVVDVPYDKALVGGRPIVYDTLSQRSREAWLRVAVAVSAGLVPPAAAVTGTPAVTGGSAG